MKTKLKFSVSLLLAGIILFTNFGSMPGIVYAEDDPPPPVLEVEVILVIECGDANYNISWTGGSPPYLFIMNYGDGDTSPLVEILIEDDTTNIILDHTYVDHGNYEWIVQVEEKVEEGLEGLGGSATGIISLDGPAATLTSLPFPPFIVKGVDDSKITFTADAVGGTTPYTYTWDLNGDEIFEEDTGLTPSLDNTYDEIGKFKVEVKVTDDVCGFTSTASLPVVVVEQGDICHPTAQKISDAVNSIFPAQAGDLYTCEDIYDIFNGSLTGDQIGFGRMWKAYQLTQTIEDLTWEEIRDWHLDAGGWGALLQFDRFSDLLVDHSIGDLMALVLSEEFSLADVRTAVRSVTRYEADFEDALSRIAEGANAGELGQLYKLAADLEVDPTTIDGYLAAGLTLSELKHTANFAERMEVDWTEVAEFRENADSWGDIKQAYNMATDEMSVAQILILGVQEFRKELQEADKEEKQMAQKEERNIKTAEKLAEQFSAGFDDVMLLFSEGECEGNWGCVRKALRDQKSTMSGEPTDKDIQTALQISSKYGYSQGEVLDYNNNVCSGDWACTRKYFREKSLIVKKTGKPEK